MLDERCSVSPTNSRRGRISTWIKATATSQLPISQPPSSLHYQNIQFLKKQSECFLVHRTCTEYSQPAQRLRKAYYRSLACCVQKNGVSIRILVPLLQHSRHLPLPCSAQFRNTCVTAKFRTMLTSFSSGFCHTTFELPFRGVAGWKFALRYVSYAYWYFFVKRMAVHFHHRQYASVHTFYSQFCLKSRRNMPVFQTTSYW